MADRTLTGANPPPPPATAALPGRPARVVLLTMDGLRYRSAVKSPQLAALAARSTWYDNARAIADATLVSMPVILTGNSIPRLTAVRMAWRDEAHYGAPKTNFMREGVATGLAGYLAPAGYRSYFATMLIEPTIFGLQHEFAGGQARANEFPSVNNVYNVRSYLPLEPILANLRGRPPLPPDEPAAIAKTFADALTAYKRDEPYVFVWAHLGGAHAPFRRMERGSDGRLHPVANTEVSFWHMVAPDDAGAAKLEALYEDNVRYLDQELGVFLARLQADPRWSSTLLVLTADHGQEFVKHATPHGTGMMTEGLTHVPLVIHDPGQLTARRESGPASSLDVVPSVLARIYRDPPSLPGLALGSPPADRMVYVWGLYRRYTEAHGVQQVVAAYRGRYKYKLTYPERKEQLVDWTVRPSRPVERPEELALLRAFVERELLLPARRGQPSSTVN
jgi:arylsulfatase A-like enzyme